MDWEVIPHYSNELEAYREVRELNDEARAEDDEQVGDMYVVEQLAQPCVHVVCDRCGDDDPSDEGYSHFDPDYLEEFLADVGWVTVDGALLCNKCAEGVQPHVEVDGQEHLL
jgi:hypothetical protein